MTLDVLAIGDNEFDFHQFSETGPVLRTILEDTATLDRTTDRAAVTDLPEYDVYVDYTTRAEWTDEQLDAIRSFVRDGGGYVGIHCAADVSSFVDEPCDVLGDLVGGRFVTHPEMADLDVEFEDREHPVTAGLDDFTIHDEPYELDWDPDRVHVLAAFTHESMGRMPAAWTRTEGDGRVFYCSLGHDRNAFETDGFQSLVRRGVEWAGRER